MFIVRRFIGRPTSKMMIMMMKQTLQHLNQIVLKIILNLNL